LARLAVCTAGDFANKTAVDSDGVIDDESLVWGTHKGGKTNTMGAINSHLKVAFFDTDSG